ncbi:MAG: hypothetical protein FWF96_01650 [Kiritimatiellaeota bacterium]|nr:hypothetical protein [Kiritimatiellota bacterium]
MKSNIGRRAAPATPVLAIVALLLTIGVVATTPLAFAKYAANATVAASARVAKWDVVFTQHPSAVHAAYNEAGTFLSTSTWTPTTSALTFKIKNNSEVAADVTIYFRYVTSDSGTATASSAYHIPNATAAGMGNLSFSGTGVSQVTANSVYRFTPGAEGTFTFTQKKPTTEPSTPSTTSGSVTNWENCIRKYRIYFNAVQID